MSKRLKEGADLDAAVAVFGEEPKIEVGETLHVRNEKELGEAIEKIRATAVELHERDAYKGEVLMRVGAELRRLFDELRKHGEETSKRVDEARAVADEAAKIAKNGARTTPGWGDENAACLRALPLFYEPEKGHPLHGQMTVEQFSLLSIPDQTLQRMLDESTYKQVRLWREYQDTIAIYDAYMQGHAPHIRQAYIDRGGWRSTKFAAPYLELSQRFMRALDTSTTEKGKEWVPTGFTATLIEDLRAILQVVNQIEQIPMPTNPYKPMVLGRSATTYLHPEQKGEPGPDPITASQLQTLDFTLTAVMHSAFTILSKQAEQDSIIPMLPTIREDFAFANQYGLEDAYINGQKTATIDLGSVPAATDVRKGWDGFRYAAQQTAVREDQGGTITVDGLIPIIGKMGKYARVDQCFWVTGYQVYARMLVLKDNSNNALVTTRDKLGEAATLITGVLGILLGYPLLVSDAFPQNLNITGTIDDGNGTSSGILLVNRRMWRGGQRQALEVESSTERYFEYNQIAVKSTLRPALSPVVTPNATNKIVGLGYNIPNF